MAPLPTSEFAQNGGVLFSGDLSRRQYINRWSVWFLVCMVPAFLPIHAHKILVMIVWILAASIYRTIAMDIGRLRNAGLSPWLLVLGFIPFVNGAYWVILFVVPEKRAPNNSPDAMPGQRSPAAPSPSSGAPQL